MEQKQLGKIKNFLEKPRIAVVATIKKDGTPQLSPNWYIYKDEFIYISTTKSRAKYWNLNRDRRVTISIYSEPLAGDYVVLEGECDILPKNEIFPITEQIVKLYVSENLVKERVEQIKKEDRVLLRIKPKRFLSRFWGTVI